MIRGEGLGTKTSGSLGNVVITEVMEMVVLEDSVDVGVVEGDTILIAGSGGKDRMETSIERQSNLHEFAVVEENLESEFVGNLCLSGEGPFEDMNSGADLVDCSGSCGRGVEEGKKEDMNLDSSVGIIEENKRTDEEMENVVQCGGIGLEKNLIASMEDNSASSVKRDVKEKALSSTLETSSKLDCTVVENESVVECGDVTCEERGLLERKQNEVVDGSFQSVPDPGAVQFPVEEETSADETKVMKELLHSDLSTSVKDDDVGEEEDEKLRDDGEDVEDGEEDEESVENDEENVEIYVEECEDPCDCIPDTLADRKKEKKLEIYVGGLDKGSVEEDLIEVFGNFGEIKDVRIVRNPTTKKSKGFAFLRYATAEQANNALSEFKDGIEVRGKLVKISASQDNDTLYMGNICKVWTKDQVLERLKAYEIEHVEEIHLPDDPDIEGRIKGYALLEFRTHSDALGALQRLRKPDVDFGCDKSAKVAFSLTPIHPSEEFLSQLKTVYVEGKMESWNEEKLKEICEKYGNIEKVKLSCKLGNKRKDFGFITYATRESALACLEGINSGQIGEGVVQVKAEIAKPHSKGRIYTYGGFKLKKESGQTPELMGKGNAKSKRPDKESERIQQAGNNKSKGTVVAKDRSKGSKKLKGSGGTNVPEDRIARMSSKPERTTYKRKDLTSKVDSCAKREAEHSYTGRPSKKPRGNTRSKQSYDFMNQRNKHHYREEPVHAGHSRAQDVRHTSRSAASTRRSPGPAHRKLSGSKTCRSDMEPHAGYVEPSVVKKHRHHAGYIEPSLGNQDHPRSRYLDPVLGNQDRLPARYLEPALGRQPHTRYAIPAYGIERQSHAQYLEPPPARQTLPRARYLEPIVERKNHNAYDYGMRRRAVGYEGESGRGSAHRGGSALVLSRLLTNTSYAGYEDDRTITVYDQSRESYSHRTSYY